MNKFYPIFLKICLRLQSRFTLLLPSKTTLICVFQLQQLQPMTIFANLLGCFKKKKVHHHTHNNVPLKLEQEQSQNMYAFYKHIEKQNQLNTNFLSFQPHVTEYLRDSMVDWLTSLHFSNYLTQPTLFLAVNIFDRFLSVELVLSKHDLKMVAIVALVIASKFEERRFPCALTLMENGVGSNYSQQQIIAMEKNILQKLEWKLLVPTILFFLVEILDSCGYFDREFKNMAFFFGEVALNDYHATISYSPSTLAVSAIYAAMCVLKKSHGSKRRFLNTNQSHSKKEVIFCAEMLQGLANMAPNGKLMRTVSKKYSDEVLLVHSKNMVSMFSVFCFQFFSFFFLLFFCFL